MCNEFDGNRNGRPAVELAGRPWSSPAIAGRPWSSPAIAGRPWSSPAIAGRPWSSPAIAGDLVELVDAAGSEI